MDKLIQNERDGGGGRRMWPGGDIRCRRLTEENAVGSARKTQSARGRGEQESEVFNHVEPQIY